LVLPDRGALQALTAAAPCVERCSRLRSGAMAREGYVQHVAWTGHYPDAAFAAGERLGIR
jgi:hypothetical protein